MEDSKFFNKKKYIKRNYFKGLLMKLLICVIIFMFSLIIFKANPSFKDKVYSVVFENNFSFAKVNKWFKDHFGGIVPIEQITPNTSVPVFSEKLVYEECSAFNNGVKLVTTDNYLVPFLESGIIVYIGEKEKYGNTIIVQQIDGIDVWYSNVEFSDFSLYDYVEKGSLVGEVKDNYLYMVFQKDGSFLNYKNYV